MDDPMAAAAEKELASQDWKEPPCGAGPRARGHPSGDHDLAEDEAQAPSA